MPDELENSCRGRVGEVLNMKWRLDELLGVGGMAAVYSATHRNGAKSAIKLLHTELAVDREIKERFLREAYIANKVDHPGAVGVLDDDLDEFNTPYLVMELLDGETLDKRAIRRGGTLPVDEVLAIVEQLLSVLAAAHAAGIVHRDIKPENIFITTNEELKVLDFGIARLKDPSFPSRTKTGIVFGTPAFMTPEQALGRHRQVDERTDLFAVGAIIFNLVSGAPVHDGSTANEIVVSAATRPPRSLSRVAPSAPISLVRIVDKALQFEPTSRYASADEMRRAVVEVREEMLASREGPSLRPPAPAPASTDAPALRPSAPTPTDEPALHPSAPTSTSSEPSPESGDRGAQREVLSSPLLEHRASAVSAEEIELLRDLFKLFDRTLTAQKQYTPDHPEVARHQELLERHLATALEACPGGLLWDVKPYAFSSGDVPLWEPEPPFDRIPYQLFADGLRTMALMPGLEPDELASFLRILTMDRARDMPPEDDFVTLLWEVDLQHVEFEAIDSFSEGDQAQRGSYERARNKVIAAAKLDTSYLIEKSWKKVKRSGKGAHELEDAGRRLVDRLVVSPGPEMEAALRALSFGEAATANDQRALERITTIDDSTYVMLGARLQIDPASLAERFAVAAAAAFIRFAHEGAERTVGNALRRAVDGLAEVNPLAAVEMVRTLCGAISLPDDPAETERIRAMLAGLIVSQELMKGVWSRVASGSTEDERESYVEGLSVILGYVDDSHLPIILSAFGDVEAGPIFDVLLRYIERVAAGHEGEIAVILPTVGLEQAMALITLLAALDSREALEAISHATTNPDPVVRIEAIGHLEGVSSGRLRAELRVLLQDKDPEVRLIALKAMEAHSVMVAGPFLAMRVRAPSFSRLPLEERKQAFSTLSALAPGRTESICLEVLDDARLMSSSIHEETRAIAAETLGRIGSSEKVLSILDDLSRRRWKNTERVRLAARRALSTLASRGISSEGADEELT